MTSEYRPAQGLVEAIIRDQQGGKYVVDVSLPSSVLVYGLINHDNGTAWDGTTLRLMTPVKNPNKNIDRNSKILTTTFSSKGNTKATTFWYDRISLPDYVKRFPDYEEEVRIPLDEEWDSSVDLIPWFNYTFGLGLQKNDVNDQKLNKNPNAQNTFTIATSSLAWMGTVTFVFDTEKIDLGTLSGTGELIGVHTQETHPAIYGQLYGYIINTDDDSDVFSKVNQITIDTGEFATLLARLTDDPWVNKNSVMTVTRFNTYGAIMAYNGETSGQTDYPERFGYNRLLVVNMDIVQCAEFQNALVIYYNVI